MIDKSNWKNYTLGNLFELVNSKAYHNKDIVEVGDENGLLYVTRSKFNNGIKCKVEKRSEYIINPAGTISFGAENADFFIKQKNTSQVTRCITSILVILVKWLLCFLKVFWKQLLLKNFHFQTEWFLIKFVMK